ncbi:MAG: hypothetical protein ACK2T0_13600 [Anaerolineales bacterium]
MTLPSAVFGLLCALLIGALFHVVMDGGPGKLLLYLILSVVGFAVGQWVAASQGWTVFPIGPLDLGIAATGSLVLLLLGHWLSLVRPPEDGSQDRV